MSQSPASAQSNPALMNILLGLMRALAQMRQQETASQREEAAIQNPQYRMQLENANRRRSRAIAESVGVPPEFSATHPILPGEDDDAYASRLAREYADATNLAVRPDETVGQARRRRRRERDEERQTLGGGYWRMQWKLPGQPSQTRVSPGLDEYQLAALKQAGRRYAGIGTYAP